MDMEIIVFDSTHITELKILVSIIVEGEGVFHTSYIP